MWNIVRSQNYQTIRDNFIIIVFIVFTALMLLMLFVDGAASMTGAEYFNGVMGENEIIIVTMNVFVVTRIIAQDYNDKTINYEMLTGHSRKEVYWARVITSLIWGVLNCMVVMLLPLLLLTMLNGWGNSADVMGSWLRIGLSILPLLRLSCISILLSTIMKNSFKGLIISFVVTDGTMLICTLLEELLNISLTFQFGFSNIMSLLMVTNAKEQIVDGESVMVGDTSLSIGMILGTILISLIISGIYLIIGYLSMWKADRD